MSNVKIKIVGKRVILPLYHSQGGIRIADENGQHTRSPTKAKNNPDYSIEWMITNEEIRKISNSFLKREEILKLIEELQKIKDFVEESKYSKRETIKIISEKLEKFLDFEIYKYTENFYSFENILPSKIKVRITFKLGDYGIEPHPHMYVLLPFDNKSVEIKNNLGKVQWNETLGSGCFSEYALEKNDISEIIKTLAHSSNKHRNALIDILKP